MQPLGVPLAPEVHMFITGKCHCGNIAFELEWEGERPDTALLLLICVKLG